jgi:hypothetical protein
MPRIRLLGQANVGGQTRFRGEECDVDADTASSLLAASRAEIVRAEQPDTPERARSRPETARRRVERR